MDGYPNSDEEFELQYADELELLREQPDLEEPVPKSRRSLNFNTPSQSNKENSAPNTSKSSQAAQDLSINDFEDTFEEAFLPISQTQATQKSQTQTNSKKRTIEELFGDIDDLLAENATHGIPKRQKSETSDLELIEHILQLRKLAKERHNPSLMYRGDSAQPNGYDSKSNLSLLVPKYPFVAVTRDDGMRVYVRCHSEQFEKDEMLAMAKNSGFRGVMGNTFKDTWKKVTDSINSELDNQNQPSETEVQDTTIDENHYLWVDFYKPKRYVELLSDETTNRTLLKWIKLWDKAVFNRRPKVRPEQQNNSKKNAFQKKQDLMLELDEDGRPKYKVALLCGPPGLGKTTLAHMVAKHAGYNVIEINASDDRSTEHFKTALETATQMRSVLDRERRPNCLVFDEIDGAPVASIDYLIKFINGTARKTKKTTDKSQILKRPIICICNDVYVPALRNLRQMAMVINFPPTASARLAERLGDIARRERVKSDMGALMALCEKTHNDIRACLSVLHFFKASGKPVTLTDVYRTSVGQKDIQKGLFSVWQDIFYIERPKLKPDTTATTPNTFDKYSLYTDMSRKSRMAKILSVVSSFGDYDRLAQGVFENFPQLQFKDSVLQGTSDAAEWFCFSDVVSKTVYATQNYSLATYLQYAFVAWHFVFGSMTWQKLSYPNKGYEVKTKTAKQSAVVAEVLRGLNTTIRVYTTGLALKLDILPILMKIIVADMRPVSTHLYSQQEKDELHRVVGIMVDYNLSYVQERTIDGTYVYNMDPAVDELTTFPTEEPKPAMTYSNKQLIAHEVELERIRRNTIVTHGANEEKVTTKDKVEPVQPSVPNHLQKLSVKEVTLNSKTNTVQDFFRGSGAPSAQGKTTIISSHDIWYQYKEGYSNAVRKPAKILDLK